MIILLKIRIMLVVIMILLLDTITSDINKNSVTTYYTLSVDNNDLIVFVNINIFIQYIYQ